MKRLAILALILILLTSACDRSVSTAGPISGRNPFTPAAAAHLCVAADLESSSNTIDATGSVVLGVTLVNRSKSPCVLAGAPQVTLTDNGQTLDLQYTESQPDQPSAPLETPSSQARLTVAPGESAVFILVWGNYCGETPKDSPVIHLALPESASLEIQTGVSSVPHCDAPNNRSTAAISSYSYPP